MKEYSKIIHIDMDAYFASVEQRDFPELRGKPIAVGGKKRGVVAAASYEARKYGVKSAMPSIQAEKLCPHLIFVKGRREEYVRTSQQVMDILSRYTNLIEKVSIDEAYLDVTELIKQENLNTKEVAIAIKNEIKNEVKLTASAGVSFNKFLAKVASDYKKPDGLFVIHPNKAKKFVKELNVKKIPGVGKVTLNKLNNNNIFVGSDIIEAGKIEMTLKFGKLGKYLHDLVTFNYDNPVKTSRIRKSIGTERTFSDDISELDDMDAKLFQICKKLAYSMNKKDLKGRTITLKIKFHDFRQVTRSFTQNNYIKDFDDLYYNSLRLLKEPEPPKQPVRLLGVQLSKLNTEEIELEQLEFEF